MRSAPHTALPRVKGMHQPRDSAVFFPKQTAPAAACEQRASVQQAYSKQAQAVKGVKRGRAVIHILPLPFFARLCNIAGRRLSAQHSHPPPTLSHRKTINNQRTQTVKGRRGEGSSTQLNTFALCSANMPASTQQVARHSSRFPGPFAH